ncbi:MAG: DNA polymerase III subunit gamma/tau [Polyangiaceae bacterium]|nr:DNA polymerase III subunit gamma/tau [Polyangiaceae bacterium]
MSYVVLARKWRPMGFEDLVGQKHVAKTLAGAIANDRVAHAFLFTGVRGVGKTTSARILAKALNCTGDLQKPSGTDDPGPTATPCLKCPACVEIGAGTDVDVREIDGASYNGVDEVRKLQDSLPYQPTRDRFKIYIVDEVHMLSNNAWNAFLKTLEEPPPHVKFIFATTEANKIPVTILSRVQRFDFRLIKSQAIADRLSYVMKEEGIEIAPAALRIIAREAAGSMRDAMSLLDQVVAWNTEDLTEDAVSMVLGVAGRQVLYDIVGAMLTHNAEPTLQTLNDLANQGFGMPQVARDLLSLLRDLVMVKVCEKPDELLDLPDEERADVARIAGDHELDDLIRVHQAFSKGFDDVGRSQHPRAALEMLLVRLSTRPPLIPIDQLIRRLGQLEKRLGGGGPPRSRGGPSGNPSLGGPPSDGSRETSGRQLRDATSNDTAIHSVSAEKSRAGTAIRDAPAAKESDTTNSAASPPAPRLGSLDDAHRDPPTYITPSRPRQPRPSEPPPFPGVPAEEKLRVAATSTPRAPKAAPKPHVRSAEDAAMDAKWRGILQDLGEQHPELAAFYQHAVIRRLDGEQINIAYDASNVLAEEAAMPEAIRALAETAAAHLDGTPKITVELDVQGSEGDGTLAAQHSRAQKKRMADAIAKAKTHPLVTQAGEILNATVKSVRLADDG